MKILNKFTLLCIILIVLFIQDVPAFGQSTESKKDIRNKIEEKARELGENLTKICDKSLDYDSRTKYVNEAMDFFVDPDNQKIEVSSTRAGSTLTTYTIRQYLNHILVYKKYEEVNLIWEYTSLIEDITQVSSGDYEGTLRILQTFKGKGVLPGADYSDQTIKDMRVLISKSALAGESLLNPKAIKFGNIKVISTKPFIKSKGKA